MITVIGGGPAGASAAIAACRAGAAGVRVFEKTPFPRQKVCGEFFSPGILSLMAQLGTAAEFQAAGPHRYRFVDLHFPRTHRRMRLPEDGWGLSRLAFDRMLLDAARRAGAEVRQEKADGQIDGAVVEARGRQFHAARGTRLFGFKAHFTGPVDDAVSLYFWNKSCYVGINAVEGGVTNVCGLAPENVLKAHGFHPEDLAAGFTPLRSRLATLERQSPDWLFTGPLLFDSRLRQPPASPRTYWAGDQLSFVDPFTGSGMLAAVFTGRRAGLGAAAGESSQSYLRAASALLTGPRRISALVRWAIGHGVAEALMPLTPEAWLFHWTRPAL